jgi:hypothetical protein
MIQRRSYRPIIILAITAIMASILAPITLLNSAAQSDNSLEYPQEGSYGHNGIMKPGEYAAGTISSIQNDDKGNPAWIVSGLWKGSLIMDTSKGVGSQRSDITNLTAAAAKPNASANLPTASFGAMFNMMMTNGSSMHKHSIYDFTLTKMSMQNNKTSIFNGTATITMKNGPVQGVPVSIKILDGNAISIWADPSKLNNHFGNTPIFGTVTEDVIIKK